MRPAASSRIRIAAELPNAEGMLPLTRELPSRSRHVVRGAVLLVLLAYVAQAGQVITGLGGPEATHVFLAWIQPAALVLAGLTLCARLPPRPRRARESLGAPHTRSSSQAQSPKLTRRRPTGSAHGFLHNPG